tara:strand:+ start:985 stop:1206 length:222 start_codon:yes stop_codon:yes gene_type:complete
MNCEHCEDGHYFLLTFSSQDKQALESLTKSGNSMQWLALGGGQASRKDINYEGITERCDHTDVQDCELCDFTN